MTCTARHRAVCAAVLGAYVCAVAVSGFSLALGRPKWSLWPFNRGWSMFTGTDGKGRLLQASGVLADGTATRLDLSRWFRVMAAYESPRYNEVFRSQENLERLADFLCRRYNEEAPPNERLSAVSVEEALWAQPGGLRLRERDVPVDGKRVFTYVKDRPCR